MRITETLYAVQFPAHEVEEPRLALGMGPGRALFFTRRQALRFRNELVEHGCRKGKVVKVQVTYEILS